MKRLALIGFLFYSILSFGQSKYVDTTVKIKKRNYRIVFSSLSADRDLLVCYRNGEQISIDTFADCFTGVSLVDFNKDGFCDLILPYSNGSYAEELYLFDKKRKGFHVVEEFRNYSEPSSVKEHSNFYFSYKNVGCDDRTWESYLFTIENYRVVPLGKIFGQDCDGKLRNIYFFRIRGGDFNDAKQVSVLPHIPTVEQYSQRWPFIEKYWSNSCLSYR